MTRHKSIILLVIIILLGAFLRFYRIRELGTFRGDQAIELTAAGDILKGKFTLIGIKTSNSELHNGAVMYYLLAPFVYFFRFDPVAGGILQSLLSLATILVVYYLCKKFQNEKVGLIAAFIIAASSLLVRFSRQTLLAYYPLFFTGLSFFLVCLIVKKFRGYLCFLLGLLLGFMLQIHYSTLAVVFFAYAAAVIFLPKKFIARYYFLVSLGFLAGLTPLIAFELRHDFFNTRMFLSLITQMQHGQKLPAFNLFSYWQNILGALFLGYKTFWENIAVLLFAFSLLWQRKINIIEKLSFLQIVSAILFTLIFVRQDVVHYAIASYIPFILLLSFAVDNLLNTFLRSHFLKSLALAILLGGFFLINFPSYGLSDNHGWTMTPGWNMPGVEKTARIIADDATTPNYNVIMLADAENQGLPLRYFLTLWGKPALSVEKYDKAVYLYVLTEPDINLDKIDMFELNSFGAFAIDKSWSIQNGFTLRRLSHRSV